MARIEFLLEEQTADMRSFEFAYRFKVQNNGASAFNLLAVTPRLAKGIELLDVKSSTALVATQKHKELCEELTEILKDYLTLTSEQYRGQLAQAQIQIYRQLLGGMGAIFRVYLSMILPSERKRMLAAMRLALEKVSVGLLRQRNWWTRSQALNIGSNRGSLLNRPRKSLMVTVSRVIIGRGCGSRT